MGYGGIGGGGTGGSSEASSIRALSSDPAPGVAGDVYYNSTTNDLMEWDAAANRWLAITELVSTPVNTSPSGSGASLEPTLNTTQYLSLYGRAIDQSEWKISPSSSATNGVLSTSVTDYTSTSNSVSIPLLSSNTTFYWQARFKDEDGNYSMWSSASFFTTAQIATSFSSSNSGVWNTGSSWGNANNIEGVDYPAVYGGASVTINPTHEILIPSGVAAKCLGLKISRGTNYSSGGGTSTTLNISGSLTCQTGMTETIHGSSRTFGIAQLFDSNLNMGPGSSLDLNGLSYAYEHDGASINNTKISWISHGTPSQRVTIRGGPSKASGSSIVAMDAGVSINLLYALDWNFTDIRGFASLDFTGYNGWGSNFVDWYVHRCTFDDTAMLDSSTLDDNASRYYVGNRFLNIDSEFKPDGFTVAPPAVAVFHKNLFHSTNGSAFGAFSGYTINKNIFLEFNTQNARTTQIDHNIVSDYTASVGYVNSLYASYSTGSMSDNYILRQRGNPHLSAFGTVSIAKSSSFDRNVIECSYDVGGADSSTEAGDFFGAGGTSHSASVSGNLKIDYNGGTPLNAVGSEKSGHHTVKKNTFVIPNVSPSANAGAYGAFYKAESGGYFSGTNLAQDNNIADKDGGSSEVAFSGKSSQNSEWTTLGNNNFDLIATKYSDITDAGGSAVNPASDTAHTSSFVNEVTHLDLAEYLGLSGTSAELKLALDNEWKKFNSSTFDSRFECENIKDWYRMRWTPSNMNLTGSGVGGGFVGHRSPLEHINVHSVSLSGVKRIETPDSSTLKPASVYASCFVKIPTSQASSLGTVFSKGSAYKLDVDSGVVKFALTDASGPTSFQGATNVADDKWHFVQTSYASGSTGTCLVMVDGKTEISTTSGLSGDLTHTTDKFILGTDALPNIQLKIAHPCVFQTSRTVEQMLESSRPVGGANALYRFNGNADDSSPNLNSGSLGSGVTIATDAQSVADQVAVSDGTSTNGRITLHSTGSSDAGGLDFIGKDVWSMGGWFYIDTILQTSLKRIFMMMPELKLLAQQKLQALLGLGIMYTQLRMLMR